MLTMLTPPGGETRIGVRFTIEEGWHIYANDPGDAGLPTKVNWSVPAWASAGPLAWPPPERFIEAGRIHVFGYQRRVVLFSALSVTDQAGGELPIRAAVEWLACKELCVPGSAELAMMLPVRAGPQPPSPEAPLFQPGTMHAS